jgi:hypothetical protein
MYNRVSANSLNETKATRQGVRLRRTKESSLLRHLASLFVNLKLFCPQEEK